MEVLGSWNLEVGTGRLKAKPRSWEATPSPPLDGLPVKLSGLCHCDDSHLLGVLHGILGVRLRRGSGVRAAKLMTPEVSKVALAQCLQRQKPWQDKRAPRSPTQSLERRPQEARRGVLW